MELNVNETPTMIPATMELVIIHVIWAGLDTCQPLPDAQATIAMKTLEVTTVTDRTKMMMGRVKAMLVMTLLRGTPKLR
jgi:hypothetical protein